MHVSGLKNSRLQHQERLPATQNLKRVLLIIIYYRKQKNYIGELKRIAKVYPAGTPLCLIASKLLDDYA